MKLNFKHTMRACYTGFITQAIVNNLAPLLFIIFREQFGLTYEMLGRLVLINFGTQILADLLSIKYVDRIGHRRAAVLAHVLCAAGLVCLGVLPVLMPSPYAGLMIAAVIYAIGGGIIEVLMSPIVDSLPGEAKASAMSLLHSFYCWGQMAVVAVTTLLLLAIGSSLWFVLPVAWAAVPLANAFFFSKVPLPPPVPEHQKIPLRKLIGSKAFLLSLVLMLCAGASELTMSQWASLFAQQGLQVPKVVGDLLGPCLFAVLMGAGRAFFGVRGHKMNLRAVMLACGGLAVVCYAVTVFAPNPVLSLAGCAFCGLAVCLMWPGTLSLTSARFPMGGTAMFGALAVFGDIGASVGPWLTGWVSEMAQDGRSLSFIGGAFGWADGQAGLKTGLLIGIVFPLLLVAGLLLLRKGGEAKS